MATYGRHSLAERALACWLLQDYPNRELIILNSHAVPLKYQGTVPPGLRIYNEPCHSTLGDQRNRLLSLARGDFIRTWDDDDIYLPHCISQGVTGIQTHRPLNQPSRSSWKPRQSWYTPDGGKTFTLVENILEPSITFRADVARKYGYFRNSSGDEHLSLIDGLNNHEGGIVAGDVGTDSGFCYVWGDGGSHISSTLNQKSNLSAIERAAMWRKQQTDVRADGILKPRWDEAKEWFEKIERAKATLDRPSSIR